MNIHKNFLTNDKLKLDLIIKCFYEGDTGIVFHIDHGSGVHFAIDNKSISYNDIISLPESTKYPAVLSVSCYNARYDSELFRSPIKNAIMRMILGWDYSNCFAEGILFSKGGGIAYWGGVRTNFGGVESYFNDQGEIVIGEPTFMIRILTNILKGYSEGYLRMGEMSKYAHQEYIQTLNDPYYIDYCTIYGFVFLGDPVLKWPVQNEVTTYNCEYTIDPKPEIINEDDKFEEIGDAPSGNETILLVDDEEVLLEYSELILSEYGYTIITAESAKEALELLKKNQVDLMITDVIMPEMDGYQLVAEVTKLYPKIKIQILSGFSDESKSNLISDSLYKNRLHKPVSSNKLLLTIRNLLDEGK